MKKICPICEKEFDSKTAKQKTCSVVCGHKHRKGKKLLKSPFNALPTECPVCGQIFVPGRREIKTCSSICAHKLQGIKISGENNRRYNSNIPTKVCKTCGKEFRLDSISICNRDGRGQYCSKSCHNRSMIKEKVEFVCKCCGQTFYRNPSRAFREPSLYCSKACYLKYGNKSSYKVEYMINWLSNLGYVVYSEKTFDWLKNPKTNHNLFIDMFVLELNLAIEYDGKQHFAPCMGYDTVDDVLYRQKLDSLKERLCKENGVNFLRIRYDEEFSYDYFTDKLKLVV